MTFTTRHDVPEETEPICGKEMAVHVGKEFKLFWPVRSGKRRDRLWIRVVLEDFTYVYKRWDAVVRPVSDETGGGRVSVYFANLIPWDEE